MTLENRCDFSLKLRMGGGTCWFSWLRACEVKRRQKRMDLVFSPRPTLSITELLFSLFHEFFLNSLIREGIGLCLSWVMGQWLRGPLNSPPVTISSIYLALGAEPKWQACFSTTLTGFLHLWGSRSDRGSLKGLSWIYGACLGQSQSPSLCLHFWISQRCSKLCSVVLRLDSISIKLATRLNDEFTVL